MSNVGAHPRTSIFAVAWIALASSLVALILSGLTFIQTLDDDDRERTVEQRLVCLELPGPNDCGADGI